MVKGKGIIMKHIVIMLLISSCMRIFAGDSELLMLIHTPSTEQIFQTLKIMLGSDFSDEQYQEIGEKFQSQPSYTPANFARKINSSMNRVLKPSIEQVDRVYCKKQEVLRELVQGTVDELVVQAMCQHYLTLTSEYC